MLGTLLRLHLVRVLIDHFEDSVGDLVLPPLRDDDVEIFVKLAVSFAQLNAIP